MIVDDESDVLIVVEQMLEGLQIPIDSFTDPKKALRIFHDCPGKYRLIISDLRMSEMSGLDFICNIRQRDTKIKILVMSAFEPSKQELVSVKSQLGISEIILKPFDFIQFINIVERHI